MEIYSGIMSILEKTTFIFCLLFGVCLCLQEKVITFTDPSVLLDVEGATMIDKNGDRKQLEFTDLKANPVTLMINFTSDFTMDLSVFSFEVRKVRNVFLELFFDGFTSQEVSIKIKKPKKFNEGRAYKLVDNRINSIVMLLYKQGRKTPKLFMRNCKLRGYIPDVPVQQPAKLGQPPPPQPTPTQEPTTAPPPQATPNPPPQEPKPNADPMSGTFPQEQTPSPPPQSGPPPQEPKTNADPMPSETEMTQSPATPTPVVPV